LICIHHHCYFINQTKRNIFIYAFARQAWGHVLSVFRLKYFGIKLINVDKNIESIY